LTEQTPPGQLAPGELAVPREPVVRNVVIHLNNEQPVLADLFQLPSPRDVAVLCTNLRTPDGKRPVFIDQSDSTFLLPLAYIRFIEIPVALDEADGDPGSGGRPPGRHRATAPATPSEPDLEIDEEFLRKIRDA
jgi:hypothetical protein